MTVFYGIFDPGTGEFVYANAGHNLPYVVKLSGSAVPLTLTGGMAVGIENAIALTSGDTTFLYTDGITQAMNVDDEEFSGARLQAAPSAGRELPVDAALTTVTGALGTFVGEAEQSDDITCIVLRFGGKQADGAVTG